MFSTFVGLGRFISCQRPEYSMRDLKAQEYFLGRKYCEESTGIPWKKIRGISNEADRKRP